uniref:Uncharacterized protein n=1 Tax=uncultured marine group II/III euryarchaeote KM3_44_G05 TaxID=1456448 RepID=A0A075H248_9EURY|nr:hypothetical protein [uncultured marine group II/III euryarchaeote KM3_44_G05]
MNRPRVERLHRCNHALRLNPSASRQRSRADARNSRSRIVWGPPRVEHEWRLNCVDRLQLSRLSSTRCSVWPFDRSCRFGGGCSPRLRIWDFLRFDHQSRTLLKHRRWLHDVFRWTGHLLLG